MTAQVARTLRVGMVGLGMIFEETYRPVFEKLRRDGICTRQYRVEVELAAAATRTGRRAEQLRAQSPTLSCMTSYVGADAASRMVHEHLDVVCVASPDDRHYEAARAALMAGCHVLIEKPSVLRLQELEDLLDLAAAKKVLAKVVYHKLLDPDHKRLRTLVADGVLRHVNHGYCSLLEPKKVSRQFAPWIEGRNPGTYVAVHYFKLIDFSFFRGTGARLQSVRATGQRGLVGSVHGSTWDSVQVQLAYAYPDGREAAFDIHTSWVTPDNFPGYVEQEVQFRFDNAVWNAHQRRRGVEVTIEGLTPEEIKETPNHHYNGDFLEPWGERVRRGYGLEAIERFFAEVAEVEAGGPPGERDQRLARMRQLSYNDLSADVPIVAAVQSLEAILAAHAQGRRGAEALLDWSAGRLLLRFPGSSQEMVLYEGKLLQEPGT